MESFIVVRSNLKIPMHEIEYQTSRSGGPGGQHANKTSSRVTLIWNVAQSGALSQHQRQLLLTKLDHRLTKEGELHVHADTYRSQHQNKEEVQQRLIAMVNQALHVPKSRKKTRPSRNSQRRRLDKKKQRGQIKKNRGKVKDW